MFKSSSSNSTSQASSGASPNAPPANPKYDNGVRVEAKGVYMALWSTGFPQKYHWGVLIANAEVGGFLFHQTLSGTLWRYVVELKDMTKSRRLLIVLKLGMVSDTTDEWMDAIKECVRSTEVPGDEFTCRTWALAAVYELANCGFIGMVPSWEIINKIEVEAKDLAIQAHDSRRKFVTASEGSRP